MHLFYQSIENFTYISETQKKIAKIIFDFEMIAFELVALNTRFYRERILVIDTVSKFQIHLKEKL